MSPTELIIILTAGLAVALIMLLLTWLRRRRLVERLDSLKDDMVAVSGDAAVKRRLQMTDRAPARRHNGPRSI